MPVRHHALGVRPTSTERVFAPIADARSGATSLAAFENVLLPEAVVPWHRHAVEELIVCLVGQAECSFEGEPPQPYAAGSVLIIPANTPHSLRNVGAGELRQLSFFPAASQDTTWIDPAGSVAER